jgi:hypothetical protein
MVATTAAVSRSTVLRDNRMTMLGHLRPATGRELIYGHAAGVGS